MGQQGSGITTVSSQQGLKIILGWRRLLVSAVVRDNQINFLTYCPLSAGLDARSSRNSRRMITFNLFKTSYQSFSDYVKVSFITRLGL